MGEGNVTLESQRERPWQLRSMELSAFPSISAFLQICVLWSDQKLPQKQLDQGRLFRAPPP